MAEVEVDFTYVQQRGGDGSFHVLIPKKEVAEVLGLQKGDRVKVFVDEERRRWTYEMVPGVGRTRTVETGR